MSQNQPLVMELDCGNSAAKWRLLSRDGSVVGGSVLYSEGFSECLSSLPVSTDQIVGCRAASVAPQSVVADLRRAWSTVSSLPIRFAAVSRECAGVVCGYDDVSQLGVDRWAAILGASKRIDSPCVVVDAGTAITVDLLDSEKTHQGGYILPGLDLMLEVLSEKTAIPDARIPSVNHLNSVKPGNDTMSAISNAITLSIQAFVSRLSNAAGADAKLLLTGGHRELVRDALGFESYIYPDLVLDGLSLLIPMEVDS